MKISFCSALFNFHKWEAKKEREEKHEARETERKREREREYYKREELIDLSRHT